MRVLPGPVEAAVLLFVAGEGLAFVFVGDEAWPLILGWALAGVGVWLVARSVHSVWLRKAMAILLVAACLVMVAHAGLYFVPAAVALVVAAFIPRMAQEPSAS
jgi:hypothetical protein